MKMNCANFPDAVRMSYRDSFRLNAWAGIAVLASMLSRVGLVIPDVPPAARLSLALLPVVPGLLYLRAIWRWMQRLDEMQRRMQTEAVCFATLTMLVILLALDLAQAAGFLRSVHLGWEGYFAGTFFLWAAGMVRANRRYQ